MVLWSTPPISTAATTVGTSFFPSLCGVGVLDAMGDGGSGKTLQEIDAGANACSVEWCPTAGLEHYVSCATYSLASDDTSQDAAAPMGSEDDTETRAGAAQTRTGSIVLHKLACTVPSSPPTSPPAPVGQDTAPSSDACLEEAARVSLDGGGLDSKWSPQPLTDSSGAAVLACATSTGRLALHTLCAPGASMQEEQEESREGAELRQLSCSDKKDNLLLSLDWSGGGVANANIVVSQSDGAVAIWRLHPNGGAPIQEIEPWHAHALRGGAPTEAWISFFRRPECAGEDGASFVVSGADDAVMKGWDLRAGGGSNGSSPAFVCKGQHGAGVTAGQWHPTLPHMFVSGSYDESVRIWDARTIREPVSCTPTGGGLWRLKWHPDSDRGNLLLAACMHAGIRVLDTGMGISHPLGHGSQSSLVGNGELEVPKGIVANYTRHASMAYGADWCLLPTMLRSRRAVIASCSFYDSLFCLWQTPPLWAQ
ncbi:unnamed protein product [Ectocarpus sp. 12 AP-2014]